MAELTGGGISAQSKERDFICLQSFGARRGWPLLGTETIKVNTKNKVDFKRNLKGSKRLLKESKRI